MSDETGMSDDEIEVTPEMVRAGCAAMALMGDARRADVVWVIYEEMEKVRRGVPSCFQRGAAG